MKSGNRQSKSKVPPVSRQNGAKQGTETWNWVEASIWTDRMLAALDNGVKGGKWFSLVDKVMRLQTLTIEWYKVAANQGAAGVDGQSIERFKGKASEYLAELLESLHTGTYQPKPVKRVAIPKAPGKTRPLGIPVVKDRIVQTAIKMVIEPIFEKQFEQSSYGFRQHFNAILCQSGVGSIHRRYLCHCDFFHSQSFTAKTSVARPFQDQQGR